MINDETCLVFGSFGYNSIYINRAEHLTVMQSSHKNVKTGFTLIELLVVISIVGILSAILFPVFGRVRENARRASCQSNLKQIGLGIMQYTQDYDERMPRGGIWANGTNGKACTAAQPGPIYYGGDNSGPLWMTFILPYTKSTQVYYCPSGPVQSEATEWAIGTRTKDPVVGFGYAYNPYVLPQDAWEDGVSITSGLPGCTISNASMGAQSVAISRFRTPAENAMISDRGSFNQPAMCAVSSGAPSGIYVRKTAESDPSTYYGGKYGTNPSLRHLDGANHLYIDGHVKWLAHDTFLKALPKILVGGIV